MKEIVLYAQRYIKYRNGTDLNWRNGRWLTFGAATRRIHEAWSGLLRNSTDVIKKKYSTTVINL